MQQEGRQLSLLPPHQTKTTNIAIIEEILRVSLSTRLWNGLCSIQVAASPSSGRNSRIYHQ